MTQSEISKYLQLAESWVREGAALIMEKTSASGGLNVSTKSSRIDLVTDVDRAVEDFIAGKIETTFGNQGHRILGEESHQVAELAGLVWILDPIDGTTNFVETRRDYAISLALYQDGKGLMGIVYDVVRDEMFTAIKGEGVYCNGEPVTSPSQDKELSEAIVLTDIKEICAMPRLVEAIKDSRGCRRYGSAALESVEVATGRAGAFVHMWVSPWDIAAAKIIAEENGVVFTRLDGTKCDISQKGSVLVAVPKVHEELLKRLMQ